jgi:hypothetical protein
VLLEPRRRLDFLAARKDKAPKIHLPHPESAMPSYAPVSRDRHAGKGYLRSVGYGVAATEAVVPLVAAELPKAAIAMPIAFLGQEGGFRLVALLSLQPGRNLYVGPDGRWLGAYVPAALRGYPFALVRQEATGQSILCVDEGSGLVVDAGTPGADPFFTEGDGPAAALRKVLDFLSQVEANRTASERAVAALAAAEVIIPWQLSVETPAGQKNVAGLHRIDEARLNALKDETFLGLRDSGALAIAYAQLLSMGQLSVFQNLAQLQARLAQVQARQQSAFEQSFAVPREDDITFDLSRL